MKKCTKKDLIAIGVLGVASLAIGAYLSKKENRDRIKSELKKTNESIKNRIDMMDYKYNIIPCNEVYEWTEEEGTNVTIHKKAKSINENDQE